MAIQIVRDRITLAELRRAALDHFGDMAKAVVDVGQGTMAIGELHADEEALLLDQGSRPQDLWGINLYPDATGDEQIEFDSMINVRPGQGNRSRSVENPEQRDRIREIVRLLVGE